MRCHDLQSDTPHRTEQRKADFLDGNYLGNILCRNRSREDEWQHL